MTQQQWDWIGYGVWALIIWMTLKQYRLTKKEVKGSGLSLLLGDWLLFAPVPWIVWRMAERGTAEHIVWTVVLGVALAIPYIVTSRFEKTVDGGIRFRPNRLFTLILFGFPIVRYYVRDSWFHSHPLLFPNHRPDIELMLAYYIAALVMYTFVWRLFLYVSYRRAVKAGNRSPAAVSLQ